MPYCAYCGTPVDVVSYAPCPSCGRPRNGAPAPAATNKASNATVIIAVVVIVGLVFVAIVGILAAIAIPNLLTAIQRSKQKRAMADMRTIGVAIEAFKEDNHRYPAEYEIEKKLAPTYITQFPAKDGWEHPYRYACWSSTGGTDCDEYAIASAGKDGQFEHQDLKEYLNSPGATTNFNSDIVYSNGKFVQYPEGMQP